jgi:hypothetical protein
VTLPQTEQQHPQPVNRTRRDLLAVAMIAVGVIGLLAVTATVDWRLPAAVVCVAVAAGGVALGLDR